MKEINVEPCVLTREFDAPMQLAYEAWTQEDRLCQWQVPSLDIVCEYKSADICTGGSSLHKMIMPNGNEMWLLTHYHELSPYHTIEFTQYQSNEEGEILPPPMPNWPREIRATIKLTELKGKTAMEFVWRPINPTAEQAQAWEASRPQLSKGWASSFELLDKHIAK